MHLRPELVALRGDGAPQRRAQAALFAMVERWRADPGVAAVLAGLADYGRGEALEGCSALVKLFSAAGFAFARTFAAALSGALSRAPLGHLPLRHFTDGTASTLLLARETRASLFLSALDGAKLVRQPEPIAVSFTDNESIDLVLAGSVQAELVRRECGADGMAKLPRSQVLLQPGTVIRRDCSGEALIYRRVEGCLVSLRLQRRAAEPAPTREYELASGRLVHQAAGDAEDSRKELMVALLGRMQRSEAAPVLAALAIGRGSASLRWEALRECLGLDARLGFEVLSSIAADHRGELAGPAASLRAQLLDTHPELRELCLA
jgi:hypothetical protein